MKFHWDVLSVLLLLSVLMSCNKEAPVPVELDLGDILGGQNTQGFERAYKVKEFHFPQDHASHPGFRNEWWYITGNVSDASGRFYGYQVTFFRTAVTPLSSQAEESADIVAEQRSNWIVTDMWMAHAAVTDIEDQQHYQTQRFSRSNPGLAGAVINPVRIWLDDWKLASNNNEFPWQLKVKTEEFDLELELVASKKPVLQGTNGLSQKSPAPGNASYYYSYTRVKTTGDLRIKGHSFDVKGQSWIDREWSTSSLDDNQSGWNWFSLQFDNGDDLMYYQMLDQNGIADVNSQGKWVDYSGDYNPVYPSDIELIVLDDWLAEDGHRYPIRWKINHAAKQKSWVVQAVLKDQFMDLAVRYWEGAVKIHDTESMQLIGRGYLEMTRTR